MDKIFPEQIDDKNIFRVSINLSDLNITPEEIIPSLGYPDSNIPLHFSEIITRIITEIPGLCNIQSGYALCEINKTNTSKHSLVIEDIKFNTGKIVTSQFRKAESAVVFVCTIGSGMEELVRKTNSEGDPAASYIMDAVASAVVEKAADYMHDLIEEKMAGQGKKITNRYSPGYCEWSVAEQQLLFSLLPEKFCGIKLTESSLMIPIKSVSGIIGVGNEVKRTDYLCDTCGVKDCTYRANRSKVKSRYHK